MTNIDKVRNPFTSTESLAFADLIARINADEELGSRDKRETLSALRQVPKWLNRLAGEVPANAAFLRKALETFHPDHAGISKRRYQNVISKVHFALKHCSVVLNERMYLADFTPEWQALWDLLDGLKYYRTGLSRLFRFCSAQRIEPEHVDDLTFESFLLALEAESITKKPRTQHQTACRLWNKCVASIQGWPRRPVTVPVYGEFYTEPLATFPQSFQDDLGRYMDRLTHADPLDEDGPPRALKPRTIAGKQMQIRQLAAALIHQGHDKGDIASLAYLVEHYEPALRWHLERKDNQTSGQIAGMADCLRSIAKYHVGVPDELLKKIEKVCSRLTQQNAGLTEKNRERLIQFDDSKNVQKLFWFGKTAFDRAVKNDDGNRQVAHEASVALAVELLLHAPMRITNLASLQLDRHLRWEKAGRKGSLSISIAGHEVKNGEPLNFPFPAPVSNMVRTYLEKFRPRLFKGQNNYLFPSRNGKAKRSDTLGKQISKGIWDTRGLRVNPHLIRHIVAKQLVESMPGNYELPRRILGHKNSDTTFMYYEGNETKPAIEYWQNLLTSKRGFVGSAEQDGLSDTRALRGRSRRPWRS